MFSGDRMEEVMRNQALVASNVSKRAATILTPAQLVQFKAAQEQQRAMMEAGMKMTMQMIGGRQKKESSKTAP
jgi:hypothetical protein